VVSSLQDPNENIAGYRVHVQYR